MLLAGHLTIEIRTGKNKCLFSESCKYLLVFADAAITEKQGCRHRVVKIVHNVLQNSNLLFGINASAHKWQIHLHS